MDIVSDITAVPLPSESVDVISCDQVLEHLPDPVDAIREIARLLKPGGRVFLSHPYGSYLHNLPFHFNGGFTHSWFERWMLKEDSSAEELPRSGNFSSLYWNYRWEQNGDSLRRVLNEVDCFQLHTGDFAAGRIFRELVLKVIPPLTDAMPGLCPGSERRVQGVFVVAVK